MPKDFSCKNITKSLYLQYESLGVTLFIYNFAANNAFMVKINYWFSL